VEILPKIAQERGKMQQIPHFHPSL